MAINEIASETGISKMTLYKYLRHRKVEVRSYIHQEEPKSQTVNNQQVIFYKILKIEIVRCWFLVS